MKNKQYGTCFIDVTYNFVDNEYKVSMGCRIEEFDMKRFDALSEQLENAGIFDYHRELRRGYYKIGFRNANELDQILVLSIDIMDKCFSGRKLIFPDKTENKIAILSLLTKKYKDSTEREITTRKML